MSSCRTDGGRPKRRWETRADAKAALRQQRACQGIDNDGMQPYRCEVCGWFHVGHYPSDPEARAGKRAQARRRSTVGLG